MRYRIVLLILAGMVTPGLATADGLRVAPVTDPLVQAECGACHLAFPPAFLPAESWTRLMAGLPDHFGEDASLAPDTTARITQALVAGAGPGRFADPPLRITALTWFRAEHRDAEVAWTRFRRGVKSFANCAACHRGAARGWFDDD